MGSDPNTDDDVVLLDRWNAGDRDAGNRLVRKHYLSVARFFENAVSDGERQDLAQKTFEKLTTAKHEFRRECSVRTYLFVLARRVLLDHLRAHYRKQGKGELDPLTHTVEDVEGMTPSRLVAELQRSRKLLSCLRGLPVDAKQMLELYVWQGCTAEELGKVFGGPEHGSDGIPAGTIRRRIHDTKAKLRTCMAAREGGGTLQSDRTEAELEEELHALGKLLAEGPSGA